MRQTARHPTAQTGAQTAYTAIHTPAKAVYRPLSPRQRVIRSTRGQSRCSLGRELLLLPRLRLLLRLRLRLRLRILLRMLRLRLC